MARLKRRRCSKCRARLKPLFQVEGRGVPHEREGHTNVYDYKLISVCSACSRAHLEQLSHDCWTYEEAWDKYWWHHWDPGSSQLLIELVSSCTRPLSRACDCPLHLGLRRALQYLIGGGRLGLRQASSGFEVQGRTYRLLRRPGSQVMAGRAAAASKPP